MEGEEKSFPYYKDTSYHSLLNPSQPASDCFIKSKLEGDRWKEQL